MRLLQGKLGLTLALGVLTVASGLGVVLVEPQGPFDEGSFPCTMWGLCTTEGHKAVPELVRVSK